MSGNMPANLNLDSSGRLSGKLIAAPSQDFTIFPVVTDYAGHFYPFSVWMRVA